MWLEKNGFLIAGFSKADADRLAARVAALTDSVGIPLHRPMVFHVPRRAIGVFLVCYQSRSGLFAVGVWFRSVSGRQQQPFYDLLADFPLERVVLNER